MRQRAWHLRWNAAVLAAIGLAWAVVALVFAAQGYAISAYRGAPQPWWPSLGYSLAIFSVWALLTPAIVQAVALIEATVARRSGRVLVYVAGLPVVSALHVALFALLYWPVYSDGGRVPTRAAMAARMFVQNVDTNTLFYLLVVGIAVVVMRRRQEARPAVTPTAAAPSDAAEPAPLQVRTRGRLQLVPLAQIDWIQAAGDYAEVHAGRHAHLLDESLSSLAERLPAAEFARIHRQSVIRVDRVKEVRSLGRGDAAVVLANGTELRLSRRYRANLLGRLPRPTPADPARR